MRGTGSARRPPPGARSGREWGPVIHRALFSCALLGAAIAFAAPAAALRVATIAPVAPEAPEAAPIRLVEPVDGAVWTAGESATLAWAPGPGFARAGDLEEWEVFLSVDGGVTFPVRLTPHLDLSRRTVEVRVPDLPTPSGRLLLRVGDERDERSIEVPITLRIVAGGRRPTAAPGSVRPGRSLVPGEAARADGRPTLFWSEGGRDGDGWREREAALPAPDTLGAGLSPGTLLALAVASGSERLLLTPPPPAAIHAARTADEAAPRPSGPFLDRPLLLLGSRRNE